MPRRYVPAPRIAGPYWSLVALVLLLLGLAGMLLHVAVGGVLLLMAAPIALTAFARTALLLKLRRVGRREGRYGVLIDSNSPHWQGYIEEHWLPRLGGRLAVLNYSERQHWDKRDLWVFAYVAFVKSDRAYCPSAVVLVDGQPLVFRFYNAFKNAKHGNCEGLRKLESALFGVLGE